MSDNTTDTKAPKAPKKKGPIRFEAIIPVLVISIITFAYFSYYFDRHLKSLFEYVGTQANGAEVNISSEFQYLTRPVLHSSNISSMRELG